MASARIIIADPGELFARGIAELLTARGYEVIGIAPTGEEALAMAAAHPDGLVLVDESIDGEGAASLIRGLLATNPRQQTIVLNGSWDLSEVVHGLARRRCRSDRQGRARRSTCSPPSTSSAAAAWSSAARRWRPCATS